MGEGDDAGLVGDGEEGADNAARMFGHGPAIVCERMEPGG
jgi:hypothetical protein